MQVEQLTLGLVQECWVEDPIKHQANLADKVKDAACRGQGCPIKNILIFQRICDLMSSF